MARSLLTKEEETTPRFYINFQNGGEIVKDDVGQDLPGIEDAKAIAMPSARELVADNVKKATCTHTRGS